MLLPALRGWLRPTRPIRPKRFRRRALQLEALESRWLPASFTVTNALDSGTGSLRDAITQSNGTPGPNFINFDPTVFSTPKTINLSSELVISNDVAISTTGPTNVIINAGFGVRAFQITNGNVSLDGFTIQNASLFSGQNGGAIEFDSAGTLFVGKSFFSNNSANSAGAIYSDGGGTVNISDSTFAGNQAGGGGVAGAIWNQGGTLTIDNSTLTGNRSNTNEAGAIWNNNGGTVTLTSDTIDNNYAFLVGGGIWNQSGTVNIVNTILANNTSGATSSQDANGSFNDLGYNLIGNNTGTSGFSTSTLVGTSGSPINPLLDGLANNYTLIGVPTQALQGGSPALNAGTLTGATPNDERGQPRVGPTDDIGAAQLGDFIVTNTLDSGPGSLRQAILDANAHPGYDEISFNIPGGAQTISPLSQLPTITDPVAVDGYTQSGSSANTQAVGDNAVINITLDGSSAGVGAVGLQVQANGTVIRGLSIINWGHVGIDVFANNTVVAGDFIGVAADGTTAAGNGNVGVLIQDGSSGNILGGTDPASRNVISGNVNKNVALAGPTNTANVIEGNYIGTDHTGTVALSSSGAVGIFVESQANNDIIGGTALGAGNLISGNADGIAFTIGSGSSPYNDSVVGNLIGLSANGTSALGNAFDGVIVANSCTGITIGGAAPGAGNVISGNGSDAIAVTGNASGTTILGNLIGLNETGTQAVANLGRGIVVLSGATTIGAAGAPNIISGNSADGIVIANTSAVLVVNNFIGTDVTGLNAVGNGGTGIYVNNSSAVNIGNATLGNVIASNGSIGIYFVNGSHTNTVDNNLIGLGANGTTSLGNATVGIEFANGSSNNGVGLLAGNHIANSPTGVIVLDTSVGDEVVNNTITTTSGPAIDLGGDGPTPNGSGPAGPNQFQNTPVIATVNGTTVAGTLSALPNTSYHIDFYANPVSGRTFQATTLLGATTVTTDATGNVAFSAIVTAPGSNTYVDATATNLSTGDTSELSTNPPASEMLTGGSSQSTQILNSFGSPLQVTVLDAYGLPVANVPVTFAAPGSGPSGVFNGEGPSIETIMTNSQGVATSDSFFANTVAGSYTVVASAPGLNPVNFQLTNLPGAANSILISTPITVVAGVNFSGTVTAYDFYGNVATGFLGTVSFNATDTNGQVVLPSNYTFTATDLGVHTFSNFKLITAGPQLLGLSSGSLIGGFAPITVTPNVATRLTISGFPSGLPAGVAGLVTVQAFDAYNNPTTTGSDLLHFTSNDPKTVLPYDQPMGRSSQYSVTFLTRGTILTKSITVVDLANPALTATQSGISVTAILAPSPVLFVPVGNVQFNEAVATFTSTLSILPNDFSASISWGDGTSSSASQIAYVGNQTFLVYGIHTYALLETDYLVDVTITYNGTGAFETTAPSAAAVVTPAEGMNLATAALVRSKVGQTSLDLSTPNADGSLDGLSPATNHETLFIANYRDNPQPTPSAGTTYYDVRVTNIDPSTASLVVNFRASASQSSTLQLLFYDPAQGKYVPVSSSTTRPAAVSSTGQFVQVVFDDTSFPRLRDLTGTVFTVNVVVPAATTTTASTTTTVSGATALAYPVSGTSAQRTVTFQGSGGVQFALTPSQDTTKTVNKADLGGGGNDPDAADDDMDFFIQMLNGGPSDPIGGDKKPAPKPRGEVRQSMSALDLAFATADDDVAPFGINNAWDEAELAEAA